MSAPRLFDRLYADIFNAEDFSMSEYLFLYRGGRRPASPQEMQTVMQLWMTWLQDLGQRGHLKDRGQPLEQTGKVVNGNERSITDGPFAEAKDLVGGYTLILAKDLAEAAELTKGCPVLDRGGSVEVRPVMKL
jgi:hypothetical protein